MRQFSGRECKSGTVSSRLFRVQKKNMPRKKLHCSYSLVVNWVENVFRCGKRRAACACPGLTAMWVCLEWGLRDTVWRKQNEPSTWAGKLLKKVPFLSFCTWVEADTQLMVKLSSLVWETQWNGNPQSDFRCRFISFLRAWGNFISTFAMGVSWIFLISWISSNSSGSSRIPGVYTCLLSFRSPSFFWRKQTCEMSPKILSTSGSVLCTGAPLACAEQLLGATELFARRASGCCAPLVKYSLPHRTVGRRRGL